MCSCAEGPSRTLIESHLFRVLRAEDDSRDCAGADGGDLSELLTCSVGTGQFRSWEKEHVFEHEPPPWIKEKAKIDTLLVYPSQHCHCVDAWTQESMTEVHEMGRITRKRAEVLNFRNKYIYEKYFSEIHFKSLSRK